MPTEQPATPKPRLRWFHLTPGRLLVVLLAVEGILLLSEQFQWFGFNEHNGWTVLIAVAAGGLFLLFMLFWFSFALLFRWQFQFSIRSLLLLTIAVAIPSSWMAIEMKRAREQRKAVEAIVELGGNVRYVDYDTNANAQIKRRINWATRPVSAWLEKLLGGQFFIKVISINLSETEITDIGMEHFKGLTQLQSLYLDGTNVTDVGVEHLKGLTKLHELCLDNTKVSDEGMKHLKNMTQLQRLYLKNTQVTHTGTAKLQKALPNCKIER